MNGLLSSFIMKLEMPQAVPGGGGGMPPAEAASQWRDQAEQAWETAKGAEQALNDDMRVVDSLLAKITAASAAAKTAQIAAEDAAAGS